MLQYRLSLPGNQIPYGKRMRSMEAFVFVVSNAPDAPDHGVVIAATRCGAVGVLDCARAADAEAVRQALTRIQRFAHGAFGVKLDAGSPLAGEILQVLPDAAEWVILAGEPLPDGRGSVAGGPAKRVLVEVTSAAQAARAVAWGCDGLIAREGLAKELARTAKVPVWVTGIGCETVAACYAAGVAGVVIEQAPVPDAVRAIDTMLRRWREALAAEPPPDSVLLQFQQLMAQFLDTQQTVMSAYLGSTSAVRRSSSAPATSHQPPATASEASPARPLPRFVLTVTAKPRRRAKPQYYPGRISILTDDETGIAAGIAEELNRNGERAFLLRHNPDAVIVDTDMVTADLRDAAAIQTAVGLIRQEYGPIGAVIHLLPLRAADAAPASFAEWRELMQLDVRSLYALARATEADLKRAGRAAGALFAVVTGRGGDFGLHPDPHTPPTHFAVADFTKTLALDFTGVLCRVVDVDATDPVRILQEKLIAELTSPDDTLQAGLPGDRRLTIVPQAEPFSLRTARQIQRDWVILLTGGARGITAEIAHALAERCQPTLVLVGAAPLAEAGEPTGTVDTLRRIGARVEYHAVDVRDEAAFSNLIDGIYRDHGRLDAVIHGAGVSEDQLPRDRTPESFDRVVDTKADSTFLLSRKLRPESLQCLLFMSSVTAAFGHRAQADYAAADGILNGFATQLAAQWPGRVVALNWGPWDQIRAAGGAEAALREIEAGPPHDPLVALGDGPWSKNAVPAGTPRLEIHAFGSLS
jgi:NAD(P)-dependent dehydrogenase (short-subunit alcohol dehydrogenase family)